MLIIARFLRGFYGFYGQALSGESSQEMVDMQALRLAGVDSRNGKKTELLKSFGVDFFLS